MTHTAIETDRLTRRFGSVTAVEDLDISVPAGSVLGLLGRNGSGKTTTVRMLATLITPTSGTARILGYDVRTEAQRIRRAIGLTGQFVAVDPNLTGRENLLFVARLLGLRRGADRRRTSELLDLFSLADVADRPARTYSGGMRRRLDLAASLIGDPAVLFLDEPTTGLDPIAREQLWEVIRGRIAHGCTVLLTTQYLEEADRLADRIVIIDRGRKIAEGTPAELKRRVGDPVLTVRVREVTAARRLAAILHRFQSTPTDPADAPADLQHRDVSASLPAERIPAAIRALDDAGIAIETITLRDPDLDDVFRRLTEAEVVR